MTDIIIVAVIVIIIGFAGFYVYKAKKSGKKCIGCPDGCSCDSEKGGTCNCCGGSSDKPQN
ncbi:MAG: FeoB-associated Cys-rich membrane protein [Clostridia bacterium]|nr:FeoB-associated Cys-rich membrane protein [Clostridia bacterium]